MHRSTIIVALLAFASPLTLFGCGPADSGSSDSGSGDSSSGDLSQPPLTCSFPQPGASSAAQPIQVLDLGTKRVGDSVRFDVPAATASITIVEQIVSAPASAVFTDLGTIPNSAVPLEVTDSNGAAVHDQCTPAADPAQAGLYYASLSAGTGTLTFPNSTAGLERVARSLPQGTWSFVVSDLAYVCSLVSNCATGGGSAASRYDVKVILKPGSGTGDGIPSTGTLDVALNLTPSGLAPPLDAASAESDADLQHMVDSLGLLLARAGISLGVVSYVDVPAATAARVATGVDVDDLTACGDLAQLLATGPSGPQVNVFLVPSLVSSGAGTSIIGFDGTIPGPATISQTLQAGVAVSAADLRAGALNCRPGSLVLDCGGLSTGQCCGADRTAYTVAHELGHFLGLYHTTERDGTVFDPLSSTPTCSCQSCARDPGMCADASPPPASPHPMSVAECQGSASCGGGDNLMFWQLADESAGLLLGEQARVVRANPAVH